jgi:DNA-binding NarL/FixJ family response regulator
MEEAMPRRIRVLIADDRSSARRGLRALLASWPAVEVVSEAINGAEAVQMVETCEPNVVLMDVSMPVLDGLEATRLIKKGWPEVKVVILTMYALHQADAIAAGADSFLIKGCRTEDLLNAICPDQATPSRSQGKPDPKPQKERGDSLLLAASAWSVL